MAQAATAYLGLGSNLGDREALLAEALRRLDASEGIRVTARGPVLETEPVGPPGQPMYLNTACAVETTLPARALSARAHAIEAALGRDRDRQPGGRWGPRPIDIDLLLYGDAILEEEGLTVPHPEMRRRRFVLEPLAAIAPGARDPRDGRTVRELLERLDAEERPNAGEDTNRKADADANAEASADRNAVGNADRSRDGGAAGGTAGHADGHAAGEG